MYTHVTDTHTHTHDCYKVGQYIGINVHTRDGHTHTHMTATR